MSSANSDGLNLSFLIWLHLQAQPCVTAVARLSNTVLKEKAKSGHSCLTLDLRREVSVLTRVWYQL